MFFLRWTSDPDADVIRNFSGHMQAWYETKDDAFQDYNNRLEDGRFVPYPPREDKQTGMWNSEPEWGLSGCGFDSQAAFTRAISDIKDIAWHHKDALKQELYVFKSDFFKMGDGFDGEDVFKDATVFKQVDENITFEQVMDMFTQKEDYAQAA